jgi:hypothetical protein
VLVIDDWALSPARDSDRHDLLEVIEDRYGNRSTIITSQLPPSKWHEYLGDPTVADAILDRLLHNAHRIVLKGSVPPEGGGSPPPLDNHQRRCAPITMPLDGPITMRRND